MKTRCHSNAMAKLRSKFVVLILIVLIMIVKAKDECQVDENCQTIFYTCKIDPKGNKCIHKNVFPLIPLEYGGIVVLFVLLAIANMAGNSGGGLVVPLAQIFFGLDVKFAVGVSNAVIWTGAFVRYWYSFK